MQLYVIALEPDAAARQVEPPGARRTLADLGYALLPVRDEITRPRPTGPGVVLAEILLVLYFEPGVLDLGDDPAGARELTVGEHVAVDERAGLRGPVVRPSDAVVEQPPAADELVPQRLEVRRVAGDSDVLGQPDRADRVEVPLLDLPVVEVADLREMVEPVALDGLLSPRRLLL